MSVSLAGNPSGCTRYFGPALRRDFLLQLLLKNVRWMDEINVGGRPTGIEMIIVDQVGETVYDESIKSTLQSQSASNYPSQSKHPE